jgi:hypothetical protein
MSPKDLHSGPQPPREDHQTLYSSVYIYPLAVRRDCDHATTPHAMLESHTSLPASPCFERVRFT